jgi:flagellar protein FliO/FliZ
MSAANLVQFAVGLAMVLGLIVAAGWLAKRFSIGPAASGVVKVVAGAAVGQRERVVVVEVGDVWMVLGVAPGRVNPLHTMPRGTVSAQPMLGIAPGASGGFAGWLRQTLEKRRAG